MIQKKVKKVQLSLSLEQVINLYGIVSSEPEYKISMELNRVMEISLRSTNPAIIKQANSEEISFPRFADTSDLPHSWISLIKNRSNHSLLLRKYPNFDYIAAVFHEIEKESVEEFAARLRKIKHVSAVFIIDNESIEPHILEAIIPY